MIVIHVNPLVDKSNCTNCFVESVARHKQITDRSKAVLSLWFVFAIDCCV